MSMWAVIILVWRMMLYLYVGRCFIAIDSMLERIRSEATVDVYGHVTCLRAQRNYMVQTEDQVSRPGTSGAVVIWWRLVTCPVVGVRCGMVDFIPVNSWS